MAIIFYCHKCGEKGEFERKQDMKCECGHYVKDHDNSRNHVNMRNTWSGQTKVEFSTTTLEDSVKRMND